MELVMHNENNGQKIKHIGEKKGGDDTCSHIVQ